jgi:probable HAF family extracellular repeat protein
MIRSFVRQVCLGAALVGSLAVPAAAQAPAVTVSALPGLGGSQSIAVAINDAGQAVGYSYLAGNTGLHATSWVNGVVTDLGSLCAGCPTDQSIAYGINNAGVIVGIALNAAGRQVAVAWQGGVISVLPGLENQDSAIAVTLNDAGVIVGQACGTDGCRAVRWASVTSTPELLSDAYPYALAYDINAAGQIVGYASGAFQQAFLWDSGVMTILPDGPGCVEYGYNQTQATGINDAGVIAGNALFSCDGSQQAVKWVGGVLQGLGSLVGPNGNSASPIGTINDAGDIAGASVNVDGCTAPVLWSQGATIALPYLYEGQPDVEYCTTGAYVYGINNSGQLVGLALTETSGFATATLWSTEQPDTEAPVVTVSATTAQVGPPNGKMIPVAFSGGISDAGSGIASASYAVVDEYGQVQPSGAVTVNADGSYLVVVSIESRRNGNDRDGRKYTLTITATDEAGNTSSASASTTVLHDQAK